MLVCQPCSYTDRQDNTRDLFGYHVRKEDTDTGMCKDNADEFTYMNLTFAVADIFSYTLTIPFVNKCNPAITKTIIRHMPLYDPGSRNPSEQQPNIHEALPSNNAIMRMQSVVRRTCRMQSRHSCSPQP